MAEKEGCDISFERRLVDGLLSVANTSFPREVYPGLESRFSSILDRIAAKRKRRAADDTGLGRDPRKTRRGGQ